MSTRSSSSASTFIRFARVVALAAVFLAVHPLGAKAQVQADDPAFTLRANLCPSGYRDAAFAADCTEPLADFEFDVAGPVNTEATTDADGRTDLGQTSIGAYAIEALDFDPDDGFVVRCERPVTGGLLPVDIDYTSAGFDIDLDAEFARDLPASSDPSNRVDCTWYSLPDAPSDDRAGIVEVSGYRCPDADEDPAIIALAPGGDAAPVAERLEGCEPAAVTLTLTNEETGDESPVDAVVDPASGYTAVSVPAGRYRATRGDTEPSAAFAVDAGEATLVLAVAESVALDVSVRPGPTAVPDPTAAPEPTTAPEPVAAINFEAGDWQETFPNINTGVYDRAAVALYGSLSPFPTATLRFDLPSTPGAGATLTIEGLADELGPAQIAITVNGVEVFRGESGFAGWDPSAATPAWTPVGFTIPAGLLQEGANEIIVANLAESAAVGLPPYVLLSVATLTFEGGTG